MNDNFDYRAYLKSNRLQSQTPQKRKKLINENVEGTNSPTFKIGDKVKITTGFPHEQEGKVGEIWKMRSNNGAYVKFNGKKMDDDGEYWGFDFDELSLSTNVNEVLKSKIKEHISSFLEAKKSKKDKKDPTNYREEDGLEDEEITDEIPAEDIAPEEGGEAPEGLTADEKQIQDSLKIAYDNAVQIGDDKLSKQIGNTITMFTRSHVVGSGGMMESEEDDIE